MDTEPKKLRVAWYRCPLSREDQKMLNTRSNFKGFLQTGGYLGLLALVGTAAVLLVGRKPLAITVPAVVLLVLFQGMCWNFMINGFHELIHDSVFKTQWLNAFFLRVVSFLGWYNHHGFWASHTEHHKYTLHPPDDLEVTLPAKANVRDFFKLGIVNPRHIRWLVSSNWRIARGKLQGEWENALFPSTDMPRRRAFFRWSAIVLIGQAAIILASAFCGWWFHMPRLWLIPFVTSFSPCFGGMLFYFCNNSQHIGLQDKVPDFRLCCRTFTTNPFVQFLYWHMNYHTEHHMFAAVPCYNLGKLHRLIKDDMPPCHHGLTPMWKEIIEVLKKQEKDPTYQFIAQVPTPSKRGNAKPQAAAGAEAEAGSPAAA